MIHGHTSFVYQIAVLRSGELVSCGEDSTLRVWDGRELVQTIDHPCVSVWTCAAFYNGDFVTGGSDGVVRVFTRHPLRRAPKDTLAEFTASVAKNAAPAGMVGDIDVSKLALESRLSEPGTKPDEVIMINRNGIPIAFQWSDNQWQELGNIVDSTNKKMLNGREYDFVFDINVDDNRVLKLGYNRTDNPYMAAQVFIEENEISQGYLEEIANFVRVNSEGVVLGNDVVNGKSDPYTGAGRHVPGQDQSVVELTLIPLTTLTLFKVGDCEQIFKKLLQFNDTVDDAVKMSHSDLEVLQRGRGGVVEQSCIDVLQKTITTWPDTKIFPGTLCVY